MLIRLMLVVCENIYFGFKINRTKMYELQCRMENEFFKNKFNKNISTKGIQVALRGYYFWLRKVTLSGINEWNRLRKPEKLVVSVGRLNI